ncbi:MAG: hypothetical protein ACI9E1_001310 [Cryomorphaceae bacterium]|jgi:hypothetical protein
MKRRNFLKGVAATISLPQMSSLAAVAKSGTIPAPNRLAFLYVPNGVNLAEWRPTGLGTDYALSKSLKSLSPFKQDIQIISGLDHDKARANGDGPGDHARASATFLTGCQAKKTAGANIRNGISADQLAARHIGHQTKLSSLELSTIRARMSGKCDSGYSCVYQHNISWRDESTPMPAEYDPRVAFEKVFGSGNTKADTARRAKRKSVLDFISQDAKNLQKKIGSEDRDKLDEYLTSIRQVERNIEQAENFYDRYPADAKPDGIPKGYKAHIRSMFDIMTLAFKTDSTRIASFMLASEGSNKSFKSIGVSGGHHALSHHRNKPDALRKIAKIDAFYAEQLAYFLENLKGSPEGENGGNLLDNTMIVYASSIADGNKHNNENIPVILAGGGSGKLTPGRHIQAPEGTPMTNLYLSLLDRMDVSAKRIGDSSGKLDLIQA